MSNLLAGRGCRLCGHERSALSQSLTTPDFLEKCKTVHGDTYLYDNVSYKNSETKVEIICREHGSFYQKPYNHLHGKGCPRCSKHGYDQKQPAYLYVSKVGEDYIKIGIAKDFEKRNRNQSYYCDFDISNILNIYFEFGYTAQELE